MKGAAPRRGTARPEGCTVAAGMGWLAAGVHVPSSEFSARIWVCCCGWMKFAYLFPEGAVLTPRMRGLLDAEIIVTSEAFDRSRAGHEGKCRTRRERLALLRGEVA